MAGKADMEHPVTPEPERLVTAPIDDKNPNLTSRSSSPSHEPSLTQKDTSFSSESTEKADPAVTSVKHSESGPQRQNQPNEKVQAVNPENHDEPPTELPITNKEIEASSKSQEEEDVEEGVVYPGGLKLALLTFGLCITTFTVALDNTILATAIPKITTVFPNSLKDVGWYGSSYLLTTTALQPTFGRIYTHFDVKKTYLSSLCLFELGSIICAASRNSVMLIIGRAVAGAGASALFSGSLNILGFTVPNRKRPLYIAAISSMYAVSSVVGPLLGGAFTDKVTWRWCFWINLPFGAIALATVAVFFKTPEREATNMTIKQRILEIDLLGALLLICSIVCLLLALQWGGTTFKWSDSKVWGCLLGFGLLIGLFIVQQFRRGERATIPPRIIGQRSVLWSCLYSCFLSMGLYVHIYYLPFYFQAVKGTTAEQSGIRSIPYLVSVILCSGLAGWAVTTFGPYKPFMIIGTAVFTVGSGLIYLLEINSTASKWIGYQILSGLGAGAGVQLPFTAVLTVLKPKDIPTGSALAIFFNSLGGAVSISIAQNVFSNGLSQQLPKYAPDIPVNTVVMAGATHLREAVMAIDPSALPRVLAAYMLSLRQAYIVSIAVGSIAFICAWFVEWKSVKGKKAVHSSGV